jgi:hypothetical protein
MFEETAELDRWRIRETLSSMNATKIALGNDEQSYIKFEIEGTEDEMKEVRRLKALCEKCNWCASCQNCYTLGRLLHALEAKRLVN